MEREDLISGEIFDPRTVEMFINLKSDNTNAMPVIFDLKEREFIWCDMGLGLTSSVKINRIESHVPTVKIMGDAFADIGKTNLYDLIMMNVNSRGMRVDDKRDADIIFSLDRKKPTESRVVYDDYGKATSVEEFELDVDVVTPFDIDYIVSNLM